MTLELTDEIRRAVHVEDCAARGHDIELSTMIRPRDTARFSVEGSNGHLPHIFCRTCGLTWMVIEIPGDGYDDALARLQARLLPNDPIRGLSPVPGQSHTHGH